MGTRQSNFSRPIRVWTILLAGAACTVLMGRTAAADDAPKALHGQQAFHATIAGTCTNKDDFSFTGTTPGFFPGGAFRIHCDVSGKSSLGRYTAQSLAELQVTGNPCVVPGADGLEATATGFVLVVSFNATQDQLFLTLGNGSECLTPPGTVALGRMRLNVAGGTGRFEGATGTLLNVISPIALAFSALGGDGFISAFAGTLDGQITLR